MNSAKAASRWLGNRWRWLVGLAGVLVVIAGPVLPGRANNDTIGMVEQMEAGSYHDAWSPILTILWRPFYDLGFGLAYILVAQIALVFIAVGSLIRPVFIRQWSAIAGAAAICVFPTTYAMLVNVIRDTWFTAALLAGLATIFRTRTPTGVHGALLLTSFLTIMAARQNGAVVLIALTILATAHWRLVSVGRSGIARVALYLGVGVAVAATFLVGTRLIVTAAGVQRAVPETVTFYVDLDEMSTRVGKMLVPDVYMREPLTLHDLAGPRNYDITNVQDRVRLPLPPSDRSVADEAWRDAIIHYPREYLQSRWQMFTRQIGWSGVPLEAHYPPNVSSHAFPPRSPRMSQWPTRYFEMFDAGDWHFGGFVHRPWIYLAVATVAGVRFGRRWPVLYALPIVQLSVLVGLFFFSPISKSRLVYPVYVLGLIGAMYLLIGGRFLLLEELRRYRAVEPV